MKKLNLNVKEVKARELSEQEQASASGGWYTLTTTTSSFNQAIAGSLYRLPGRTPIGFPG